MKKTILFSVMALSILSLAGISAAYGGEGFDGGFRRGIGMHMKGFGLVSQEMREQFKADFQNLSEEEKTALKEQKEEMRQEMRARMEEHQAEMENFTGLTRKERWQLHDNGGNLGDVLLEQGKTQEDVEEFLTERANERVDRIVERHDLDAEQEQTLRDRVVEFVQRIISRWFGN